MSHTLVPQPSLPAWARAADAVTLVLGLVAVQASVFGGVRIGPVSIGTPWRALIACVAVTGLRHYLVRTPPLHQSAWTWLRGGWRTEAVRSVWPMVVVTRLSVLLVGYVAVVSVGYAPGAPPYRISSNEAINLPLRLDAGWYVGIAMEGYRWAPDAEDRGNIGFFPGYPLITEGVASLLGAQNVFDAPLDRSPRLAMEQLEWTYLGSALLVSLLSFTWGMVWLYRLARAHLDAQAAHGALLLTAAYPFAVFFSAASTEALMLFAVVGSFYHYKREKWIWAAACGLLAGVTRPDGFLLAGPLGVVGLRQLWARRAADESPDKLARHTWVALGVAATPVLGLLIYSGFTYNLTGDPFAWLAVHTAWGHAQDGLPILTLPLQAVAGEGAVDYTVSRPVEILNALGGALAIALIWPVTRRLGPEYGLLMVLSLAPPLLFGGFLSIGRTTSILFPMFMYLALVLVNRQRQILVAGFASVQGLAAVLFFTWRVFP